MRVRTRRFLRWATPLFSLEQMVVFVRGALVQIKIRRPQEQALDKDARDQTGKICTEQNTDVRCGNNVGVEKRENIFRINGLCLWCARRGCLPHTSPGRQPAPIRAARKRPDVCATSDHRCRGKRLIKPGSGARSRSPPTQFVQAGGIRFAYRGSDKTLRTPWSSCSIFAAESSLFKMESHRRRTDTNKRGSRP
jgi:hypothetical protein